MVEPAETDCRINDGEKMKQLKDIFASKATIWLFVELVVITVVAWAVFDPAVVNLYYRCRTLGFDTDKLLYAETTVGAWDEDASEEYNNYSISSLLPVSVSSVTVGVLATVIVIVAPFKIFPVLDCLIIVPAG